MRCTTKAVFQACDHSQLSLSHSHSHSNKPPLQDECESDLAEAIPIMNEALAALDTIKEADINYIKKLGNPPGEQHGSAVEKVMEGSSGWQEKEGVGRGRQEQRKAGSDFLWARERPPYGMPLKYTSPLVASPRPPRSGAIKLVMEAVCVILDQKPGKIKVRAEEGVLVRARTRAHAAGGRV